ncbi:9142_t:CDS:2 [Entrophospora sp. SA101]|nr:9142_t:CDS:2 [Entrophospora sp. SA101]
MNSMKYIAFYGSYETLALSNPADVTELKKIEALVIEEVSMVDAQFPPVCPSQVFRSPIWKKILPLFLTTPQRQINDVEFYRILQEIRTGNLSVRSKQIIQTKINQETDLCSFYDTTHVIGTQKAAQFLNAIFFNYLPFDETCNDPMVSEMHRHTGI